MQRRRHLLGVSAGVTALLLLIAACSGSDEAGGAAHLPTALPSGVVFADPPPDAAPAPDFSVVLVDDTPVEAGSLWADRPVVLIFTASWCSRCADVHREVAAVVDDHDGAVALLGVVDEGDEGAVEYAEDLGIDHPLAVAPTSVWDSYAVNEPPLVALIGPEGNLLRGWPGGVDPEVLVERLDELYANGDQQEG